jgi:hypothetical protein
MIPEDSERDESDQLPNLDFDISPFHIAKLRDRRGKQFKVVYRETEDHIQIEVHKNDTTLRNIEDVINHRIVEKSLISSDIESSEAREKWVNAGMRCLCQSSNNNYSLSEVEKYLTKQNFHEIIDL